MKINSGDVEQVANLPEVNVEQVANLPIESERTRTAKIIKAEDVKADYASFRQIFSTKSEESEDSKFRLFRPKEFKKREEFKKRANPVQKIDRGATFTQLFKGDKGEENVDESEQEENKANEIIEAAKRQAVDIKKAARAYEDEARALKEDAREHGYKEGYKEGHNEGVKTGKSEIFEVMQQKTDSFVQFLSNTLNEISTLNDAVLNDVESNTLKLSMIIAKKLACREISTHPETIIDVVKEAVVLVEEGKQMVIKVNPVDLELVKEYRPDILQLLKTPGDDWKDQEGSGDFGIDLRIEKDENISRGGCVIETDTRSLDATFETRLEEVTDAILSDA